MIYAVDYEGENGRIVHPHGAYLVFSSPSARLDREASQEDFTNLDVSLMDTWLQFATFKHDSSEIGSPEKLAAIMSQGWRVSVVERLGRYASNRALLTDDQLIAEAARFEGGADHYLHRTASPRYSPSWEKLKNDAKFVLLGNSAWSDTLSHLFGELEREHLNATVSVDLYNPAHIVLSLSQLFSKGELRYLPGFQMVVTYADHVALYVGMLVWNGAQVSMRGREWIEQAYGSLNDYMRMQHFRQQHTGDEVACRLLGLSNVVLQIQCPGTAAQDVTVLKYSCGRRVCKPIDESKMRTIAEFYISNWAFGLALVEDVGGFAYGWVN